MMLRIDGSGGVLVPVADAGRSAEIAADVMRDARAAGAVEFVCRAVPPPRLWEDLPVFGTVGEGIEATDRPGAYAILLDDAGRLAILATPVGRFLPGGGCDPGESPEATLRREIVEECGLDCVIERLLGEAVQLAYSSSEQRHFRKHGHYFLARAGACIAAPIEADHVLAWVAPAEAAAMLSHEAQAWVVARYLAAAGASMAL
jgi:8-oxo-dGTP diphosphatase